MVVSAAGDGALGVGLAPRLIDGLVRGFDRLNPNGFGGARRVDKIEAKLAVSAYAASAGCYQSSSHSLAASAMGEPMLPSRNF
jgi:hypothetical protein